MFDFKNYEILFFVLKFCHVWKNDIDILGKISLLSHHIMRQEKKRKKGISPTQPCPGNNSLKKKPPYPSQYHLIKLLNFSSSLKPNI